MEGWNSNLTVGGKTVAQQFNDLWRNGFRVEDMRLLMAHFALGRVFLHVGCLIRGGKPGFHLTGIRRELARVTSTCRPCRLIRRRKFPCSSPLL
jgi:hypothetical protein